MAQRDMKKILRFTSHKEMQIKATVMFPLPSMEMIIIQKSVTASEDVGKEAPSPLWVAMYVLQPLCNIVLIFLLPENRPIV